MKKPLVQVDAKARLLQETELCLASQAPALASWYEAQCAAWKTVSLPTRHTENWRDVCWPRFKLERYNGTHKNPANKAEDWTSRLPKREGMTSLVLVDGVLSETLSDQPNWPQGVVCLSWKEALDHPAAFAEITRERDSQSAWQVLNNLSLDKGLFLFVAEGVVLTEPLQLIQVTTSASEGCVRSLRFTAVLEVSSRADIWLDNWSPETLENVLINQQITLDVQSAAELNMATCLCEPGVTRLSHTDLRQAKQSRVQWNYLGLQTDWMREELRVSSEGEGTDTCLRGLMLPSGQESMAIHTLLRHTVAGTNAEQLFRSASKDKGSALYQGRVLVEPGAVQTVSTQQNHNMLLTPGAQARSRPQLEIYADDVICAHGATVGALDQLQLFYLCSRGIPPELARRLLLQSFLQSVWSGSQDHAFKQPLTDALSAHCEEQE